MPLVNVEINNEDIELGVPRNGWMDPIHRALWRATKQSWDVRTTFIKSIEPVPRVVALPDEARRWLEMFDNPVTRTEVHPFVFTIDIPERRPSLAEERRTSESA
jgi:hypothetical protein